MWYSIGTEYKRGLNMFFGTYYHQVDDRGRIRIPPALKDGLGSDFCFVCGIDGILNIYPRKAIEEQYKKLNEKMSAFNEEDQAALLDYSSRIAPAIEDKQGRVTIPSTFIEFAHLEKDVCSVGMGEYISIMSKDFKPKAAKTHSENLAHINKKLLS